MSVAETLQAYPVVYFLFIASLGLVVGSFLNVVVHRLPIMMQRDWRAQCRELLPESGPAAEPEERFDLASPGSRCPSCGHRIRVLENIPVLSYLALRGRCSGCGHRISLRYPMIELLTCVMSLVVAWRFGVSIQTLAVLLFTWPLIALSFIDLDTQLLPDSITLPVLWLGLGFNLFAVIVPLWDAVVGAMCGYGILWIVYQAFRLLTGKEGMGFGDFKLLAMLGAWAGWQSLPLTILISSILGAVVGVSLMAFKGQDREVPIPFGPYLALAGWISLLWGDRIISWYLGTGA